MEGTENTLDYQVFNFELQLSKGQIIQILDLSKDEICKTFVKPLTQNISKLYILKDISEYLYIGTTRQSLRARFRHGFKANGKFGYHGYKWKDRLTVQLYIWCFETLNSKELENIETEFAFLIRKNTGIWPISQNEIHFNNDFEGGKLIAENLYNFIEKQSHKTHYLWQFK